MAAAVDLTGGQSKIGTKSRLKTIGRGEWLMIFGGKFGRGREKLENFGNEEEKAECFGAAQEEVRTLGSDRVGPRLGSWLGEIAARFHNVLFLTRTPRHSSTEGSNAGRGGNICDHTGGRSSPASQGTTFQRTPKARISDIHDVRHTRTIYGRKLRQRQRTAAVC